MILDMGMAGKIAEISLEAFVGATEDESKVKEAMANLTGPGNEFEVQNIEGSFGNPIIILRSRFHRKADIRPVLERIVASDYFERSLESAEDRLDEDLYYHMRLDKASAYLGEPRLWSGGESIEIRIKIITYPRSRDEAMGMIKGLKDGSGER